MSDPGRGEHEQDALPQVGGGDDEPSAAARVARFQRAGGVATPVVTTLLAFLIGGFVIALTNLHNKPFETTAKAYRGIFTGTGLNWFFPWVGGEDRVTAGFDLQQTLILTTTLILTGLAQLGVWSAPAVVMGILALLAGILILVGK